MLKRVFITFRQNEYDEVLFKFLNEKARYIGVSSYIRELIHEDMVKKQR